MTARNRRTRHIGWIAVLAALCGSASAQTGITLYGIADANVRFDHTSIGTLRSVGSGGESASRWGIRGTEDLGGGVKAVFNFEQDFDLGDNSVPNGNVTPTTPTSPASSSGSRLFARRAIVGINSATLGELRFGREYTALYQAWVTADPFAAGMVGRTANVAVGNVTRIDNSITYESPSLSGLQLKAQFRPGESTTSTVASGALKNGGNLYSTSLTYAQGRIYAGVGYISSKSALDNNTVRSFAGGAIYDFDVVKIHALYFQTRNATTVKQRSYAAGATVPIGSLRLLGLVGRIDNRYDTNGNPLRLNDANFFGFGASYAMSKRTDLYTSAAKFVNNGASAFTIADASNAGLFTAANVPAGFNPWSMQFGMRHLF